jgi:hypothetical protein
VTFPLESACKSDEVVVAILLAGSDAPTRPKLPLGAVVAGDAVSVVDAAAVVDWLAMLSVRFPRESALSDMGFDLNR